ncbi:MAG: hypothetical protein IH594_12970 [Bacteroidales bacterium]|nr:hypothetical protein [Bacteroidales bacterium]
MKKFECHVISNTHWDREWVKSFQESRVALADMFDRLFEIMEKNPEFKYFHLDSQAIPLEDYNEVRPENKEKLKELIGNGRLLAGPWYTLAEMNSTDGESIVRNLLTGHRVVSEYGNVMKVGYTPTSTGQISQLPQIYRGFGINVVIFYRGINQEVAPAEYIWNSPDGTAAIGIRPPQHFSRCTFWGYVYLPVIHKYYDHYEDSKQNYWDNGGMLFRFAERNENEFMELEPVKFFDKDYTEEALKKLMSEITKHSESNVLLALQGHDASFPHEETPALIEELNKLSEDTHFIHSNFELYARRITEFLGQKKDLVVLEGEMRYTNQSCPWNDAHLYPGVISTKGRLKRQNRETENLLIRQAEPAAALSLIAGSEYETRILDMTWKLLLANHAHDTINGCSLDAVYEDAMHRYKQAKDLAVQVLKRSLSRIIKKINLKPFDDNTVFLTVFNLDLHRRSGISEIAIDMPHDILEESIEIINSNGQSIPVQQISRHPHKLNVDKVGFGKTHHSMRYHAYAFFPDNPGGGYTTYTVRPAAPKNIQYLAEDNAMENEFLKVTIERDGCLTVINKATGKVYSGLNYFIDEGESGNAWTPQRIPGGEVFSTKGNPAEIKCIENGPVKSTFRIKHIMNLPEAAAGNYSSRSPVRKEVSVITEISLTKSGKSIEVKTSFNNTVKDHRLRVLFPAGINTHHYNAAMPFDVVTRPVPKPASEKWTEPAEPSDPQLGFLGVSDGQYGLAILNVGLYEAEVLDDEHKTIAVTLLRSFYQHGNWAKDRWPDEGFQNPGQHTFQYYIYPHEGTWLEGNVYDELSRLENPLICVQHGKGNHGSMPMTQSLVSVSGNLQVSCLKQSEDQKGLILRIYNPSSVEQPGRISFSSGFREAWLTDLEENPLEALMISNSEISLQVEHHKIITLKISRE